MIRALLYRHHEGVKHFRKTDHISREAQFIRIKQKITTRHLRNFRKMFGKLSVYYRQTAGDPNLTEYPTMLVLHFLQVYLSKQRDLMVTESEVHTALDGPRIDQSNPKIQSCCTIRTKPAWEIQIWKVMMQTNTSLIISGT